MGDWETIIYTAIGGTAGIAGMVAYGLIRYRRPRPQGSARPCPECGHVKAGHDSLGCSAKVTGSMGSQRCPCNRKYGEPR